MTLASANHQAAIDRAELLACLHRVTRGDRLALEEIYRRTNVKLFSLCARILVDRAEAEDVLQEVYITVWNKADQFDEARGLSPMTWLLTIARNRSFDRLRSRRQYHGALDEAVEVADTAPLADIALASLESAQRLNACLDGLDGRTAQAIRAAFFGGQTYECLATAAGTPLGSMKSLIRRGLMRLKACLGS
ncbi:sigma-70 family RNA polymerase sigma factor [Acidocella sp.]|uniref:sigma-70 family RNA polymerase sigma factor n=1 Tax=Acidocella sp. TaxID=50710 RepID=UPI0025B8E686|nr:sigma-70 family RNA polymerase sigma factor [Acidocella sp.]